MEIEAFENSPIGKLVPISGHDPRYGTFKHFAYVPAPLPKHVPLEEETYCAVADAAMNLGRLFGATDKVPNPMLLARPSLRKEAVSTSALEGTFTHLSDVLEGEVIGDLGVSAGVLEVINYVRAAEKGVNLIESRPIGLNLISELQSILVEGTRGDSFDAGQLRKRLVFIGIEGAPIASARFVPPPPGAELLNGVSDWEKWIHEPVPHVLVRVALGHYQFETLHPFSDGNGRIGRLLVALQLIEAGVLKYPLLSIAEWLEPRRDQYQDLLLQLSRDGRFDPWITFFCTGVKEQAALSVARIDRLLQLKDDLVHRVATVGRRRGGVAYQIAEQLIGFPILDVPRVAKLLGISYQSARDGLEKLVTIGVLDERRRSGKTRRIFLCPQVLTELERA